MSTYKITNITNTLGKRNSKHNSNLDIEYVDEMTKKKITIKPNDCVYLTTISLPLSVHRLRVKKLITVVEVSENELKQFLNTNETTKTKEKKIEKPKAKSAVEFSVEESEDIERKSVKKKTTKKETEE